MHPYYGKNLDALYDCLTSISEPLSVTIYNYDSLKDEEKVYLYKIIEVINDVENVNLQMENRSLK